MIRGEIFHLPKMEFNITGIQGGDPIRLNKLNLEHFKQIQEDIEKARIPELRGVNGHHSYWNSVIIICIVITILCIIIYRMLKTLYFNKKRQSAPIPGSVSTALSDGRQEPF